MKRHEGEKQKRKSGEIELKRRGLRAGTYQTHTSTVYISTINPDERKGKRLLREKPPRTALTGFAPRSGEDNSGSQKYKKPCRE